MRVAGQSMVRITCPHCRAAYQVRETSLGKASTCKRCSKRFRLSAPQRRESPDDGILRIADFDDRPHAVGVAAAPDVYQPPRAPLPPRPPSDDVKPPAVGRMGRALIDDRPPPGGFIGWLRHVGRSLLFFTNIGDAVTFGIMTFIYCISIFAAAAPLIGGAAILIINGWIFAFQLNVLMGAAAGEDEMPSIDTTSVADAILIPLLKYLAVMFLSFVPFMASITYAALITDLGPLDALELFGRSLQGDFAGLNSITTAAGAQEIAAVTAMWAAAIVGSLFQPIMFLVVAVGGFMALIRWDLMAATIVKTFPAYMVLFLFYLGMTAIPTIAAFFGLHDDFFVSGNLGKAVAAYALKLYCSVLAMRAIGLFYHHLKGSFAWSWG